MRASLICIRGNAVTRHTMWAPYIDLLFRLNAREIPTDMEEAILSVADSSRPKLPAPWRRNYRLKDPIKQLLFEPEVKMVLEKASHALSDLRDLGWMVVVTSPLQCAVKRRWSTAGDKPARELDRSTR